MQGNDMIEKEIVFDIAVEPLSKEVRENTTQKLLNRTKSIVPPKKVDKPKVAVDAKEEVQEEDKEINEPEELAEAIDASIGQDAVDKIDPEDISNKIEKGDNKDKNDKNKTSDDADEADEAESAIIEKNEVEKKLFEEGGEDISLIINESMGEICVEEGKKIFDSIIKITLSATAQSIALPNSDVSGRKGIQEVVLELTEKKQKDISSIFKINHLDKVISDNKEGKDGQKDLILEYKDAIFIANILPNIEKAIINREETPFLSLSLKKIIKTKETHGAFLYAPLRYYQEVLSKEMESRGMDQNERTGTETLLFLIEEMQVFNIFEEDIFQSF